MRVSLAAPIYSREKEIMEVLNSLESAELSMGVKVARFEKMWAEYCGVKYAVMVNSGSSANLLMLTVLKNFVGKGEVITPAVTWATTVFPIAQVGLTPVLVDVDWDLNISLAQIRRAITPETKAIFPVHLLGNPARMAQIRELAEDNDLLVIEDACEAHGATIEGKKVGGFGEMGTFSFYVSHHITTIEGGMIVTDNEDCADRLRALRAFGWTRDMKFGNVIAARNGIDPRFCFAMPGYNLRPTEVQGAFGIHQLPRLERNIQARRENAAFFNDALEKYRFTLPRERDGFRHVFLLYAILSLDRNRLQACLEARGIDTRPVISGNMAVQPVMKYLKYRAVGGLPISRYVHDYGFCVGCHPGIGEAERQYMIRAFEEFHQ